MTAALVYKKKFQRFLMEMTHLKVILMHLHAWNPLVVQLMWHCLKLKRN
jgi:hypothetical protein